MARHGGGDGDTMKNSGNWKGNSSDRTEEIRKPESEPIKEDIIKPEER